VSSYKTCSRFPEFINGAPQNFFNYRRTEVAGVETKNGHSGERSASHRVDIADGVCGAYRAEGIGIINYRGYDVNGLDQKRIFMTVYTRVIAGAYYYTPASASIEAFKYIVQVRRTQFCRSAGCLHLLRKSDIFHMHL
jgi:hypothetical protein